MTDCNTCKRAGTRECPKVNGICYEEKPKPVDFSKWTTIDKKDSDE